MNIEALIQTAADLPAVPPEAAEAYDTKRQLMVAGVNAAMAARPDVLGLVGPDNLDMMRDNHANHALFVASVLRNPDATVLTETVLWVFRAYRSRGFALAYWSAQLNAWNTAVHEHLAPEHAAAIQPLYDWFILRQPAFAALSLTLEEPAGATPSHG